MISNYPVLIKVGVVFLDVIVTVFSYIIANKLRTYIGLSADVYWHYYWNLLLIIIIVWRGLSEYLEAYAGRAFTASRYLISTKSLKKEISIVLRTVLFGCPTIYLVSYLINFFVRWEVPKSLLVIFGGVNLLMLTTEKIILYKFMAYLRKKEKNIKKVLVLGTGDVAKHYIDSIAQYGLKIIGLIGKKEHEEGKELFGYKVVGNSGSLEKTLHSYYIDELVVALPAKYLGDIEEVIAICDREGVPVRIVSPFFRNLMSKSRAELIQGIPNIVFMPVERNDLEVVIKRLIDVIVSLVILLCLSPLLLIIAVLVKKTSKGPIFYNWRLVGLHNKHFISYKFRTMVENAEDIEKELRRQKTNEMDGVYFKLREDFRVTTIGRFLRKYSLDEIPQLYSVLKGDMSLVGPRPVRILEKHELDTWHRRRFCVKPGVTSPWVVEGKNEISQFDEIVKLDLEYIDKWTLWLDIKILMKTIPIVLFGKNF